jgi:hypothetical protein
VKVEEYRERKLTVAGWEVNLTSYRLESEWHAKADDVSPGATLARAVGPNREEAEEKALARATDLLDRTRRHTV